MEVFFLEGVKEGRGRKRRIEGVMDEEEQNGWKLREVCKDGVVTTCEWREDAELCSFNEVMNELDEDDNGLNLSIIDLVGIGSIREGSNVRGML